MLSSLCLWFYWLKPQQSKVAYTLHGLYLYAFAFVKIGFFFLFVFFSIKEKGKWMHRL